MRRGIASAVVVGVAAVACGGQTVDLGGQQRTGAAASDDASTADVWALSTDNGALPVHQRVLRFQCSLTNADMV